MFKLVIQDDEGKTTVVPLIRDEITIGRKEGNTIRLTERNVSRRHARILRNNGEVHIEDLGSYNGIRVNNARIAERVSLRVSDQVQIGDYKLYLKAEGIEQVDDARTMPIERVDTNGGAPTEVIPAIAGPSPTAPVPIQAGPAATPVPPPAAAAAPQIVGNPARTLVAISGDDLAGGRPVATAAAVAALTQPVGHGKLVVLSSNFAGKEFELTRLQMIIGRTDENDIVINHRSISRNHAKVVREPDSGRYTISDLQSSNGVRVNGQDYGKVELRRGDVVDLGHVRLRFIEPGEDFVFSRDAVITDVPESGGKRGMLVAIILGVVVLGAAVAFFLMKNNGGGDTPVAQGSDAGLQHVVLPTPDAQAGNEVVQPDAMVAIVEPDASTGTTVIKPPDDLAQRTFDECNEITNKQWQKQIDCATTKLKPLDAKRADDMIAHATKEREAGNASDKIGVLAKNKGSITAMRTLLEGIDPNSVYAAGAKKTFETAKADAVASARGDANLAVKRNDCKALAKAIADADKRGTEIGDAIRTTECKQVAVEDPHPVPPDHQGSAAVTVPPPPACDAEEHKRLGADATNKGEHAKALGEFEAALHCKPGDGGLIARAYMEACQAGVQPKAKQYFARLPPTGAYSQQTLEQMCVRNHIDPRK